MAKFFYFFLLASLLTCSALAVGSHDFDIKWARSGSICSGSVGECSGDDEFGLGSETHRRFLATANYIGYNALRRDSTPCSQSGASYYNCRPGASANPYSRGCSAITQCRGG